MARIPLLSPHGANGVLPESCMVIGRVVLINNNNKNKHKNTLKTTCVDAYARVDGGGDVAAPSTSIAS